MVLARAEAEEQCAIVLKPFPSREGWVGMVLRGPDCARA
jgi:hypothetical protein